jgi:hypothetical protein
MVRDWTIRRKPLCRGILRDYTSDIRRDEKRCSRDTLAVLHVSPAKSVRIVREPMERMKIESTPVRKLRAKVSEIPCRVSSDLHEWSNDLGAVSMGGPAKLQYQ